MEHRKNSKFWKRIRNNDFFSLRWKTDKFREKRARVSENSKFFREKNLFTVIRNQECVNEYLEHEKMTAGFEPATFELSNLGATVQM